MGERGIAAVRDGEQLHIYHSQWGGSDTQVRRVLGTSRNEQFEALTSTDWQYLTSRFSQQFIESIDFLDTEVVYLVSTEGVQVYQPVWTGFDHAEIDVSSPSGGRLVRMKTGRERRQIRTLVQCWKGVLYRAMWDGSIDEIVARELLVRVLDACWPASSISTITNSE